MVSVSPGVVRITKRDQLNEKVTSLLITFGSEGGSEFLGERVEGTWVRD